MSTYFARSMRSLTADSYRPPLVGVVIASLIFLAWGAWFVLAPIPVFVTGRISSTTGDGMVIATFDSANGPQLQVGQSAVIIPDGTAAAGGRITATVTDVANEQGKTQVTLYAKLTPDNVNAFAAPLQGKGAVEVERVSLAILVFRASSQFVNPPAISLTPQTS